MSVLRRLAGSPAGLLRRRRFTSGLQNGVPTLIFGAGEAGRQIISSILRRRESRWTVVGLLDDNPAKRGRKVHGIEIYGGRDNLADVARVTGAQLLLVATPAFSDAARDLSRKATELGLRVKVVPDIDELLSHDIDVRVVRDMRVDDLLGRQPVDADLHEVSRYLTGKRVLVVGAGGSIGSELCQQICRLSPSEVIMLDRDESALLATQLAIYKRPRLDDVEVVLADIRDARVIAKILAARRPHVVFHAAALKHVATLERHPGEALQTNVLGTWNVLEASAAADVERFVNISTDKAADPSSVLGYSKRIAEGLTSHAARVTGQHYISVRFGNVLGSRGSVLSTFLTQITEGQPVTVTAPEATRYFMTIQEAVQLVIRAGSMGSPSQVLILDMGEPVRIIDLARRLMDQVGAAQTIEITGLRPGEKVTEVLFGRGEEDVRPAHPMIAHIDVPPVDLDRYSSIDPWAEPGGIVDYMRGICAAMATELIAAQKTAGTDSHE